ncbi:MAG TPA: class I SAM-dependent methyltransferase [Acidimicrobiales bacterium]|nr:class I SAM-dependent methyltransferase [Acidimicrobiales bacterium]
MAVDRECDPSPGGPPQVEEPLIDAALLAFDLAPLLCTASECVAYHRLWPWLRVLGLASSPERHREFFSKQLRPAARTDRRIDVLVSGCADQAMLAHVAASVANARVTVVDKCGTPLALCDSYARRREALDLQLVEGDIRDVGVGPFDLITTHSFLSQFRPDERPELISAWLRLLAPDGRVVTTTRLEPTASTDTFADDAVHDFGARVLAGAHAHDDPRVRGHAETLGAVAEDYARTLRVHSVATVEELEHLFREAGFGKVSVTSRRMEGMPTGRAGPTMRRAADYAEIVAVP